MSKLKTDLLLLVLGAALVTAGFTVLFGLVALGCSLLVAGVVLLALGLVW